MIRNQKWFSVPSEISHYNYETLSGLAVSHEKSFLKHFALGKLKMNAEEWFKFCFATLGTWKKLQTGWCSILYLKACRRANRRSCGVYAQEKPPGNEHLEEDVKNKLDHSERELRALLVSRQLTTDTLAILGVSNFSITNTGSTDIDHDNQLVT